MKKILLGILLFTSVAQAQDLLLQTRMEQKTFSALIDKTRVLLSNSNVSDRLSGIVDFKEEITFPLNDLIRDPDYLRFRELFTSVFKLDLNNAILRVRIPKIGYQIAELHANPLSMSVTDPVLDLNVIASVRGLVTSFNDGMNLDVMIPNPVTNVAESYLTAYIKPTTITVPDTIEPITFGVTFQAIRDKVFSYVLKNHDLSGLPAYVDRHMNDFTMMNNAGKSFSVDDIEVNPVVLRLNNLSRTIKFDAFKPMMQQRLKSIISLVFSKVGQSLQTSMGPKLLKTAFSGKTPADLTIKNSSIVTRFVTAKFSQPTSDQLYLGVVGELCTAESYQQHHEQCAQKEEIPEPVRSISASDREKAQSEITESIARGSSDLVLSVSEEYLNRLIAMTIKTGLWKESMEKQHLALGPGGAFIILDERTQTPALYMDVLYYGDGSGGIEGLLVNANRPLRFPLRISASVDFVNKDGSPHLVIKTEKILSDVYEILNGYPEYGLRSHLIFGLRKKVAREILEKAAPIEGQVMVDLDLPVLKNIDLEKTWHEASPFGRLNLFFKM